MAATTQRTTKDKRAKYTSLSATYRLLTAVGAQDTRLIHLRPPPFTVRLFEYQFF